MAACTWRCVRNPVKNFTACLVRKNCYSTAAVTARAKFVEDFDIKLKKRLRIRQKYIVDENVAKTFVEKLGSVKGQAIIEANPGPGVLTRALVAAGAQKIIMLEPEKKFHSGLLKLQKEFGADRLELCHGDFNKIDGNGPSCDLPNPCRPPLIPSRDLFSKIRTVDWQSGRLTARFVGTETDSSNAAKVLMSNCMRVVNRDSIFRFGRSELAFFYPEKRAQRILAKPGEKFYNRLAVLLSLFCEVNVLHKEPCSSFDPDMSSRNDEDMFLISLIPKRDSDFPVSPYHLPYAAHLVRLMMAKRAQPILNALEAARPGSHIVLDQEGLPYSVCAKELTPAQIGRVIGLFLQQEGSSSDSYYNRR